MGADATWDGVAQRRHEIGALSLATLEWGEPGAPLALLVHGYPDSAWTWRHLGPYLAERGWHAVAPFTRGYGPSDPAPDDRYFVADLGADLLALRRALAPEQRAVLIGHDWGALTAWHLTATAGDAFDRYVMLAVPPGAALLAAARGRSGPRNVAVQSRLSWYFLYNQLPVQSRLDRAIPKLWSDWSPGYDAEEDVAHVMAALDTPERRRAALHYYRDNVRRALVSTFTMRPGAPALYLHGVDDGCIDAQVAACAEPMLVPGSRFMAIPGAGHFLQLELPERIGELVSDWIGAPRPGAEPR